MSKNNLALLGGEKLINQPFNKYNSIGIEEKLAVSKVMDTGILSKFVGAWGGDFDGGPYVKKLEEEAKTFFNVKHAISVNSWTSGLIAAVGALGIEPGDEIILSPWTMSATAMAILHWNAVPVFADIESETFCINPISVQQKITEKTKAIIAIDIFGHSANMDALMSIAKKNNLKIISDTAQAPGAFYHGKYAGTLADIGGFSLNYHKHIHCGEGGILVTNNDLYAERLKLIRNHGESVVKDKGTTDITNIIGFNFRLGEIESAISIEQLKKLKKIVERRQQIALHLSEGLKGLDGLRLPITKSDCTHVYYMYPLLLNRTIIKVDKQIINKALQAEGLQGLSDKYQNIHLLPIFQQKHAFGTRSFPWALREDGFSYNYQKGICPVAEEFQDHTYMGFAMCMHEMTDNEIELTINVFKKVWNNLDKLENVQY